MFKPIFPPANLSEKQAVYRRLLVRKSRGLLVSAVAFGLGLAAFAGLISAMLYQR